MMATPFLAAVWRTHRLLTILFISLLLLNIALFAWIGYGLSPRIDRLERRYIESQNLHRRYLQGGGPVSARSRYRQVAADLETFRREIPDRGEFTRFLRELFTLAGEAGLDLKKISYAPKELKGKGLLTYSLDFSEVGDYRQIKKFIHSLEQSPRIIGIDEISLAGGEKSDKGGVKLSIRLTTYFRSEPR